VSYSPLSIAAMPPVLLVGSSWAMDPSTGCISVRGAPSSVERSRRRQ
jgi:hypothetical protein